MARHDTPANATVESLESAIRALVVDSGPSVHKLVNNESEGARTIMAAARTPESWSAEEKATAVIATIVAVIDELTNRRWKRTAQAAFRIPAQRFQGAEFDSLAARWRDLGREDASQEGIEVDDAADRYRGYWRNSTAPHIARALMTRIDQLNTGDGWQQLRKEEYIPSAALPLSFERTEVLYHFEGTRGVRSTCQRWLIAHGPVEYYDAVGWYYNDPDAGVDIVPIANCRREGSYELLPQGGRKGRLRFARRIESGERYYFSYETRFNSDRSCRPTILQEIRGQQTELLTVRAQFDPRTLPVRCWYFDVSVQSEGSIDPPEGAPQLLTVAPNGYVDHEFRNCQHGRKYGLRWTWPTEAVTRPRTSIGMEVDVGDG
ncbi:hypothetical protein Ais01nite_26030 [Asanoa ishikariensis]|uniref:Uncharacterized protein n=1 Tax=Asanoa ishikariensis TaxID=137265 RepID=A0A1H3QZB3_9ACTN|nr:hypothetical protein [Asanoa ishikariensis]GIF64568.1 hypothetical protein Ais01nite_26030 [Asanoa ishikariensis]SDZ18696.1 hypothetical protein SAMN05421684_3317 [Asanoa ishikariensis]